MRLLFSIVGLTLVLLLPGCGDGGMQEVRGIVTLNGEPLQAATVTFAHEDGQGRPASGFTDEEGQFQLTTYRPGDGIPHGTYRITVNKVIDIEEPMTKSPAVLEQHKKAYASSTFIDPRYPNRKSVLPWVYRDVKQTPFKCTVPLKEELQLDLDGELSGPIRRAR